MRYSTDSALILSLQNLDIALAFNCNVLFVAPLGFLWIHKRQQHHQI